MVEIIKCKNCGNRFPDNPEKHKYRSKYCPKCLTVYKRGGLLWKLNIPFEAFRDWLSSVQKSHYERDLRGRALHQLKLEKGDAFSEGDVLKRVEKLRSEDIMDKESRKRRKRD